MHKDKVGQADGRKGKQIDRLVGQIDEKTSIPEVGRQADGQKINI